MCVKHCLDGRRVFGEALDAEIVCFVVGEAEIVFGRNEVVFDFLEVGDGFVDLFDGVGEFATGETIIA